MNLKTTLIELIRYSFEHMRMYENNFSTATILRSLSLDMLAHQIGCFLAQNTKSADPCIDPQELVPKLHMLYGYHPDLTIEGWINWLIKEHGGEIVI
jgi:hypothetical protein